MLGEDKPAEKGAEAAQDAAKTAAQDAAEAKKTEVPENKETQEWEIGALLCFFLAQFRIFARTILLAKVYPKY